MKCLYPFTCSNFFESQVVAIKPISFYFFSIKTLSFRRFQPFAYELYVKCTDGEIRRKTAFREYANLSNPEKNTGSLISAWINCGVALKPKTGEVVLFLDHRNTHAIFGFHANQATLRMDFKKVKFKFIDVPNSREYPSGPGPEPFVGFF